MMLANMGKRKMGAKCSVRNCSSYRSLGFSTDPIRFFRFPRPDNMDRVMQWKLACSDENIMNIDPTRLYNNYRICSAHFDASLISTFRLSKNAVPTLNLFQKPKGVDVQTQTENFEEDNNRTTKKQLHNAGTQTAQELSQGTPRKIKLRNIIKSKKNRIRRLSLEKVKLEHSFEKLDSCGVVTSKENFKNACDIHLPSRLGNIVKTISDLTDKKQKGRRYTNEFKQYALSLYYSGPKTYKKLVADYQFPSLTTLRRMTENIQKRTGLNDFVFRSLKWRIQGKEKEARMCILSMDEMSLKANLQYDPRNDEIVGFHDIGKEKKYIPAKNALVLMARGIHDNWKQPLGYYFLNTNCSAPDLRDIISECIVKLDEIGLDVRALVSDMGSNFVLLSKNLGITENSCEFQVNGKKLRYIFDVPHLMKCIRNILMKYEVVFEDKVVMWKHVEELYDLEKTKDVRLVTKLTDAHVYPNCFQKMKVQFATQVFSSTVVSAMSTYIANGQMNASAACTASFLQKFDQLFDILNSSSTDTVNQFKQPYRGTEDQEIFLKSMLDGLRNMKVFSKTNTGKKNISGTFKSIGCFQVTIISIMSLWKEIEKEGYNQLNTRRLNQDCLENFFGKVRQQGGCSINPTPIQFMHAFKKLSCMDLLDCADTFNCAADFDKLLMGTAEAVPVLLEPKIVFPQKNIFKITNADFRRDDLPSRNVEQYISGYLLRKCLKKHCCITCEQYANSTAVLDSTKLFCYFKGEAAKYGRVDRNFGKLLMPEELFVEYVARMEETLIENAASVAIRKPVEQLFEKLRVIPFEHPCPEFPYVYLVNLFIRMRIFYIVKYAHRKFKSDQFLKRINTKSRKLQILKHQ